MNRIAPESSVLVVVDVQERLAAAMPEDALARLVQNTCILLESARLTGATVIATEQYPKGLGKTLAPIAEKLAAIGSSPIEKLDFSALDDARARDVIASKKPKSAIVIGMESHVCVFQTARDLVNAGYETFVVADAVASRTEENRVAGLALAERAGAIRTVTEAVAFDWVRRAEGDTFKAISKLVR
jgi:nicotinamidase-related amidase